MEERAKEWPGRKPTRRYAWQAGKVRTPSRWCPTAGAPRPIWEREPGKLVLNCTACGMDVHWVSGSAWRTQGIGASLPCDAWRARRLASGGRAGVQRAGCCFTRDRVCARSARSAFLGRSSRPSRSRTFPLGSHPVGRGRRDRLSPRARGKSSTPARLAVCRWSVTFVPKDRTSSRSSHEMSLTIRQPMVDGLQQQDSSIERGRRRPDRALPSVRGGRKEVRRKRQERRRPVADYCFLPTSTFTR